MTLAREARTMDSMRDTTKLRELLSRVGRAVGGQQRARLLDSIAWPRSVEDAFFASGAGALPKPVYEVDRAALEANVLALRAAHTDVEGDGQVSIWLRDTITSFIDSNRLLLAAGTRAFSEISKEVYGGARTQFIGGIARNVDLADHLLERLTVHGWDEPRAATAAPMTAAEFASWLRARIASRAPAMEVEVVLDARCSAKVVAGASRVRVREDATFLPWEAEGLYVHEVETHSLTAQNGAAQPAAPFLRGSGPRATRTQEGLAIFAELYSHALSVKRMERLAMRVKLVDAAEQGASFLDLYRMLLERGSAPREAYFDAQRICRGGLCEGGAPFTKDACYLAGLLQVVAFLTAVVRGGFRDEMELLVCGRMDLDDIDALAELRALGLLSRPKYLPTWLDHWEMLLPYFAFMSFMDGIDLAPVERHYRGLVEVASAARAPGAA